MSDRLKYVVDSIAEPKTAVSERKWGAPGPESRFVERTPEQLMEALLVHCRTSYEQCKELGIIK